MGQALSQQELFLQGFISLIDLFKTRGIWVIKKDLKTFFDFVGQIFPWHPQEGSI